MEIGNKVSYQLTFNIFVSHRFEKSQTFSQAEIRTDFEEMQKAEKISSKLKTSVQERQMKLAEFQLGWSCCCEEKVIEVYKSKEYETC